MKEYCYIVDYNFFSPINDNSPSDFISTYVGTINQLDPESEKEIEVGKIVLKFILVGEAINNEKNIHEIFDSEEYIIRLGSKVFDFKENDINQDIQEFYKYTFNNSDLCIIQRIDGYDDLMFFNPAIVNKKSN